MSSSCSSCFKPKANLECHECHAPICKNCAQFVDDEQFSYDPKMQTLDLTGAYCLSCHEKKIVPVQAAYDELMQRARDVSVFFTDQGKETRLIKRSEDKFTINECADRDETVLRLAFLAAKAGYNGIVDVDLTYSKSREGSFKIASWSGTGTAAKLTNADWFTPNGRRSPSR
jgi:hypothetical protein